MEKLYGVVFREIYGIEDLLSLYCVEDIIRVRVEDEDGQKIFRDEKNFPYLSLDDLTSTEYGSSVIGHTKTLSELKVLYPDLDQTEDLLRNYLEDLDQSIYLARTTEESDPKLEIKSLDLNSLNIIDGSGEQLECVGGSISATGEVTYLIGEPMMNRLLKIKNISQLKKELIKISESADGIELIQEDTEKVPEMIDVRGLYSKLSGRVINQDDAIKAALSALAMDQYSENTSERTRCLLAGPTGCGKSEIIRTISEYLNKPLVHIDSAQLTIHGYEGRKIEEYLMRLVNQCNGDIKKAENGIIVLDEIDKKGFGDRGGISGRAVLDMLLGLLDGTDYELKGDILGSTGMFNTSNLTIFAAGAFTDVFNAKLKLNKTLGFNQKTIKEERILDLKPEDFIKFGSMTDEFMGRFPVISVLNPLDEDTLVKILLESTASPLKAEVRKLKQMGIKLLYEDEYIRAVASKAVLLKTGGRSLKSTIERSIMAARFEVLMNPGVYSSIKLTGESVDNPESYRLYKKRGR